VSCLSGSENHEGGSEGREVGDAILHCRRDSGRLNLRARVYRCRSLHKGFGVLCDDGIVEDLRGGRDLDDTPWVLIMAR